MHVMATVIVNDFKYNYGYYEFLGLNILLRICHKTLTI